MQLKTSSSLMVASPRMEFPSRVHSQSSTSATLRIWLLLINLTMGASSSYFLQLLTFSRILTESVSTPLRRLSQSLSNGRTISMRRLKAKLTISPVLMMRMSSHLLMKMKNTICYHLGRELRLARQCLNELGDKDLQGPVYIRAVGTMADLMTVAL